VWSAQLAADAWSITPTVGLAGLEPPHPPGGLPVPVRFERGPPARGGGAHRLPALGGQQRRCHHLVGEGQGTVSALRADEEARDHRGPAPAKARTAALRYCGRDFSVAEMATLSALCSDGRYRSRAAIARAACEELGWVDALGRPKAMSARVAMLRMAEDGLIELPPPRHANNANRRWTLHLPAQEGLFLKAAVESDLRRLPGLRLVAVDSKVASRSWNEAVARHHYLGYVPLSGAQRRYFVQAGDEVLALLGMGRLHGPASPGTPSSAGAPRPAKRVCTWWWATPGS
jgi:hypothetical protein